MKFRDSKVFEYIISVLVIVLLVYLLITLWIYFNQSNILYQPESEIELTPTDIALDFENVKLESSDGVKLTGWFIPAENSDFTVLFCHGNAGNISHRLETVNILHNLGVNCFIFDYRGYGESEGEPSEQGTYLDAMTAYLWLKEQRGVSEENIIIFGRSLGGAIAAQLAGVTKPAGMVLESTFTSYLDAGEKLYPLLPMTGLFAEFSYNTLSYVKDINSPIMFIHSREDELLPFEFAETLYENASRPKRLIEITGGHNTGFFDSQQKYTSAWEKWMEFLNNHRKEK